MDRRKMNVAILGFVGVMVMGAFLLGCVTQTAAETLKCKTFATATTDERKPVGDEEGHVLVQLIYQGLALFENGEIATVRIHAIADTTPGKGGQSINYNLFTFDDGSTIIIRNQRLLVADTSGTFSAKQTGELLKGTGRFEGIKGTVSSTGRNWLPKNEEASRTFNDVTFTYTLPGK